MKRLTKKQQTLLECALDKLYTFIKEEYKEDYFGENVFAVYNDIIRVQQCSIPPGIAWFADIELKYRKIHMSIRTAERDKIYSKRDYNLIYMSNNPKIHTIDF